MRAIKVQFADFWGDFNPKDNFIINVLRKHYVCVLSDEPEYLFFSTFGFSHLQYDCVKIMFVGENIVPDFNVCDYALGFDWMEFGDRYMRLPLYLVSSSFKYFPRYKSFDEHDVLNRRFCSIVVSNAKIASPMREHFFKLLSEYKRVDSGGRLWNNIGGPVTDKLDFISRYKFNIAFENSSVQGYTTEKIMDPMVVNSLPIYWGNPLVCKDFNTKSFINVNDFLNIEEAVKHIVKLDTDDELYIQMLKEPWIADFSIYNWQEDLFDFLANIIEKPVQQAKYITNYGMQYLHKRDLLIADFFGNKMKLNKLVAAFGTFQSKYRKYFE